MKKLFSLMLVLISVFGLAACQPKEEELEEVTLTVWASELDQTLMQTMIDSFKEAYKDEAIFTITLGAVSEATAKDQVLNDIEAAADVFAFADDQINELYVAGALQEVQENTAQIIAANGGAEAGAIKAATKNGKLYAYPMTADNGYFLFYDKSVYSENDVKTLDGILAKAQADGSKFTMQINNGWYLYSFFAGAGLQLTYDGTVNSANWNNATGVKVTESIIRMATHPGYINLNDAGFVSGIKDGSVSAGVNGVWNATEAQNKWGANYAATKLPTYTLDGQQVQMSSFAGYKLMGVNALTLQPYWAMKLAEWFTNEDNQILRFQERGLGPSNVNAANSTEVKASPAISALAQQGAFATVQNVGGNYWSPTETFGNMIVNAELTLQGNIQEALNIMVQGIVAQPIG